MNKTQQKRRARKTRKAQASNSGLNLTVKPDAAGIDIGAEELVAAVPPGRDEGPCVRTFSSFTHGVEALRDWLLECGIKTVAIESTGNYWITCYSMLEDAGIEVCLVNARHVKGVPGKKTDVCDAQWLQQLHSAGLLRKSFRPDKEITPLRYLMRHRGEILGEASRHIQHMQKVMTEMNLHVAHVFSDVDGLSAQAIISAILAGERDARKLAALRDWRCKAPEARIIEALRGDYREEYLFVLGQSQRRWQQCMSAIVECDAQIARLVGKVSSVHPTPTAPTSGRITKLHKHSITMPIHEEAQRFYGVDLSAVPGVNSGVLSVLMSELGTGEQIKASFRSAEALASWMGLCPDNRISGGVVLKAKTRKVPNRVAAVLRMAAQNVARSDHKLGELCRRMKARLGKAEGIVAVAHKLIRIIYGMIKSTQPYDESVAFKQSEASKGRRLKNLMKQAKSLGFQVVPAV